MKQILLKTWLILVCLLCGAGTMWAETKTGTITFGTNDVKINAASVTGDDNLGNTWTITTVGTTSFTTNATYYQVGSSSKPATSITFTTTLPENVNVTKMSAKFGGFSGTAGTITLKVGDTTVGTGSLNAANDVTVNSTSTASGTVLTVTVTGIAKGVKVYNISYTYASEGGSTPDPTPTVAAPTFSPAAGTYSSAQNVTISAKDFDYIYYTTDGTSPIDGAGLQMGTHGQNVSVAVSSSMTIKAVAYKGTNVSEVAEAAYVISTTPQKTLSSISVTTLPTKINYTVGETLDLTGCVVTATYSDASTENVTSSCTYSPANGATMNTEGSQTVSVSYSDKTASFIVTVNAAQNDPQPIDGGYLLTDIANLRTGDIVVIVDQTTSMALGSDNGTAGAPKAVEVTLSNDKSSMTSTANNIEWTVTVSDGKYKFSTGNNYLYVNGANNNGLRVGTNGSNKDFEWATTSGKNYHLKGTDGSNARYVGVYYNNSIPQDWRCYTSINANIEATKTAFYVKQVSEEPEKEVSSIAISGSPVALWTGDEFSHEGVTVIATYADGTTGDVTSSASFEGCDMTTAGSKTVTVSYAEKQTTYSVTVNTIANTQETAYSVARAKELIDAGNGLKQWVYVAGKISQIDSYSDQYKSITYWISADGTTADQFEVYSGKNLNNTDFAAVSDIVLGADVVIYGTIKKYSTTYEFDKNNYLVSYTAPVNKTKPVLSFSKPFVTAYLDALDEFEALTVSTNPVGLTGVQYSSSDDTKAMVDVNTGVVTISSEAAPGSVTITASYAESDEYAAADDASYIIKIEANKPVPVKRAIVAVHDGKYYAMTTTNENKKMKAVEVSIVQNKVVYATPADITWNWTETAANKGTLETEEGIGLVKSGTGTDVKLNDGTLTTTVWTIDGTKGILDETSGRPLLTNGSVWGSYAASNIGTKDYSTKASLMEIAECGVINFVATSGNGNYYSTFSSDKNVVIPEMVEIGEEYAQVTAYTVAVVSGEMFLNNLEKDCNDGENWNLPANTGYLLKCEYTGDSAPTVVYTFAEESLGEVDPDYNMLHPGSEDMSSKTDYEFFKLTYKKDTTSDLGFYWGNSTGTWYKPKTGGAYLAVPKSQLVNQSAGRAFVFDLEGTITSIENAISVETKNEIYDLTGRRVVNAHNGVYVVNGKKIIK